MNRLRNYFPGIPAYGKRFDRKRGMSQRVLAKVCGVTEEEILEVLARCDAGIGRSELKPLFYGKWRVREDSGEVDTDAVKRILNYFVMRTYNPVAYYNLDKFSRAFMGQKPRIIDDEEMRLYKQDCEARDPKQRDN